MRTRIVKLNDRLAIHDLKKEFARKLGGKHSPTFYTEISAREVIGENEFGETLFENAHNETVLGGALTVLEKLWGIPASLKVDSINNIMGINADISPSLPESSANQDDYVVLWGVGIGGCGDAYSAIRPVHFYEREIGQNNHTDQMIPFRVVTEPFTPTDDNYHKYFMLNHREDGLYEYYLKAFETTPVIKVLWKDGAEGEDGSEVEQDVYNTDRTDLIEAFIEMHLRINKKDIQEYFELIGQPEMARVNTLGLFTARKVVLEDGRIEYVNCKLFSKLNMNNDPLTITSSGSDGSVGSGSSRAIEYTYRVFVH